MGYSPRGRKESEATEHAHTLPTNFLGGRDILSFMNKPQICSSENRFISDKSYRKMFPRESLPPTGMEVEDVEIQVEEESNSTSLV